ncbi:hypothetical protein [Terrabacter sp. Root181]|uniref:hypothetical protein n=1 Tax=Terrabacter sp. Root181 TaxID=1736484 RepID=UPI0006FD1716|nr:hypothetical protein [Terrabacter sp. Root181]KRB43643.1 hypothetical protein ASD90_18520 [Terrabacter sp. Root181]
MRKTILGLVAIAALATPLAFASSANAATTAQAVPTGHAIFHATQPSGSGGNWLHTYDVDVAAGGGFSGTNVIKGLDGATMVTVNETVSGQITDKNNDGVKEVTLVAIRTSGLYTFEWSVTDAPMDGTIDSMTAGTTSYATAVAWTGGLLPITFTAPEFPVAATEPVVDKDNHGEYVSGAAHAGITGKDLAAIAKDKTLVGPYMG